MEIAERLHQPGYRRITRRVFELRPGDGGVIGNITHPGELTHNLQHPLTGSAKTTLQHIAHYQRPGVDKRIARFALFDLQL